jgi:hypothetical protein
MGSRIRGNDSGQGISLVATTIVADAEFRHHEHHGDYNNKSVPQAELGEQKTKIPLLHRVEKGAEG